MADNIQIESASSEIVDMAAAQRPIDEAVETAVGESSAQGFDPKLIAQITENVIKQLRATKIQIPSETPESTSQVPATEKSAPLLDKNLSSIPRSVSPKPSLSDRSEKAYPDRGGKSSDEKLETAPNPPRSDLQDLPPEVQELTTLEKIWGVLFDDHGKATERLDQLLRGIAVHLIEDFKPKHSIVVIPEKMVDYYKAVSLGKEAYPWHIIFDDHESYVSRMYRDLGCQHHLIQEEEYQRPDIPGLTPQGFACWMTQMLLAHPEEEFERLKKAILDMPIANPDDKTERFPKDVSRRLFPTSPDLKIRTKLRKAMTKHANTAQIPSFEGNESLIDSPDGVSEDLHKVQSNSSGVFRVRRATENDASTVARSPPKESRSALGRVPTVGADGTPIPDDENLSSTRPIERERKPYTATEGSGRIYDEPAIIQPAGDRLGKSYPAKAASIASDSGLSASQIAMFPMKGQSSPTRDRPIPGARNNSVPPPQNITSPNSRNIGRSNSQTSRKKSNTQPGPSTAPPQSGVGHLPPPPAGIDIHQPHPPPGASNPHRGSTSRRRALSGSQGYLPGNEMAPSFQQHGYEMRQPIYVERAGGHDGYGGHDDDPASFRPPRNSATVRRESRDRRRESPGKRDRSGGKGYKDDDRYRNSGSH